jgi:hypothetical protein
MVSMSVIMSVRILMFIVSLFMFFFFLVFRFPGFDDDFLLFGSEIYRFPDCECLIELLDIVTRDILLSSCREMSLHDIRECIDEDIEWFSFLLVHVMISFFLRCFLDI